ncbi:MAG: HPF/RaiA family ribosome-associated protein, partial [Pseudomonadales bacterium]|nr:HPF/RaiA family ribosome-associated protein [Pseudomonadales bacterium]
GGEDMRCKMKLTLDGFKTIVVQETAGDMYDAINTCTHRVKRAVARYFNRIRQQQRKVDFGKRFSFES